MTLNVALVSENEHARQRLMEFASSQHWRVAEELAVQEAPANLRETGARFDAVVAYKQVGDGVHVFQVRYCGHQKV